MKPHGKRRSSLSSDPVERRINLLKKALVHPKFLDAPITMYVGSEYMDRFTDAMAPFTSVKIVSTLAELTVANVNVDANIDELCLE
jgi:hypothetical protein